MLFLPVMQNFRYKASVDHGNEYHIKQKFLKIYRIHLLITSSKLYAK